LDDATEEVLRGIQEEVDAAEQQRFERAAFQAQRFLEDRLLVHRRRRSDVVRQLDEAQARRNAAVGSEGRTEAEGRVLQLDTKLTEVDAAIDKLDRRENETFKRFHEHIHHRRYQPPTVERLFEVGIEIR